ncbi:Histone-lysine N-methyltransferase SETMAR [Eumeta japonica]|uniref:Histone-lysine N-methyltransferase SETMAR n=1 Tax=Eumeta variegata TaxID=151549 RepID=A0A4C2AA16_EUMVA|nr:Histone-lysine N-methyltransferase SETMAR [Eumeta japonica]
MGQTSRSVSMYERLESRRSPILALLRCLDFGHYVALDAPMPGARPNSVEIHFVVILQREKCDVCVPNAVSVRVAQNWFKRFQSGNFGLKDEPRSGRPVTDKVDAILEKVEQDRHIISYDVAEELGIDHQTLLIHL